MPGKKGRRIPKIIAFAKYRNQEASAVADGFKEDGQPLTVTDNRPRALPFPIIIQCEFNRSRWSLTHTQRTDDGQLAMNAAVSGKRFLEESTGYVGVEDLQAEKAGEAVGGAGVSIDEPNPWYIPVNDSRWYSRIWQHGSLGLGESSIDYLILKGP